MKLRNASIFAALFAAAFAAPLMAAERAFVGMAPQGARIEASIVPGPSASAPTVVLVGGWSGEDESSGVVREEVRTFEAQLDRDLAGGHVHDHHGNEERAHPARSLCDQR